MLSSWKRKDAIETYAELEFLFNMYSKWPEQVGIDPNSKEPITWAMLHKLTRLSLEQCLELLGDPHEQED